MTFKAFFTPRYKILIHILVITLLTWVFIDSMESLQRMSKAYNFHENFKIFGSLKIIIQIFTFYILSCFLTPLFITNKKTGAISILLYAILYTICISWLDVNVTSIVSDLNYNHNLTPNLKSSVKAFVDFIPLIFMSCLYSISIMDKGVLNNNFTAKQLELAINLVIIGLVLHFIFSNISSWAAIITIMYFTVKLLFFYINTFFVTPILLKEKKTGKYLLFVTCLFVLYVLLSKYIYSITHFEIGPFPNIIVLSMAFLIDYLLSFVYGYIRHRIKTQDVNLGAKESELSLLKSQVNPHFLFNTLNTLYATALEEKAPKTAESTAKLANLIRYMQEDIDKDFIPLENEIKYLQDYIAIQKLRCVVEPEVVTDFRNVENHFITPGLLIPFVENAFKYGIDPSKPSRLEVSVICDENTIYFKCINSFDDNYKTYYKEQGFGIGIKNAKQRLELVYPKKHSFEVAKENNTFSVKMSIKTKV
ncbi:sensor histidine kinase [Confluentibacter citreus]|uniref:sensor histidine kinase n=1 Tax=Confluentibacter citreus TaxID=2007307 RepID=UPI000C2914FE|nr:histidine kinase [Confluentibacter citreus]